MKNNKLIAEFMGLSIKDGVSYYTDVDDMFPMGIEVEEPYLQYHSSWDWLMPVVDKIEIEGFDPHGIIDNALGSREIEDVHDACVTLIKTYNNEEKETTDRVR